MSSYFFLQDEVDSDGSSSSDLIQHIKQYSESNKIQVYVINRALAESKYSYSYSDAIVVLVPKHKIMIFDCGDGGDAFEDYCDEFIEDLGYVSDKFGYKQFIGRPREWRNSVCSQIEYDDEEFRNILRRNKIEDPAVSRKGELLISLLTGSINDIAKVGVEVPDTLLEKIKKKIILFDGDQTRFIYEKSDKKTIRIQGISGAGKTELLLNKVKEIYVSSSNSKILLTCHNKILADSLRRRIPEFFNFMKVDSQIEWNSRLWCVHGWGSGANVDSGAYRYICNFYGLKFETFGSVRSFDEACKRALYELELKGIEEFAFDYVLIDESQDFPDSFFKLCQKVAKNKVYIAGDIFQSIFDERIIDEVQPDYLLSKCYRTDPSTLMFAHMVGMGLVEDTRLRWLKDQEWQACGYRISKNMRQYRLMRDPLRRFEDLDNDDAFESVEISEYGESLVDEITTKISEIKRSYPTVQPDEIAVIFADANRSMYSFADQLEIQIARSFSWNVNKAHESKEKTKNSVFISNLNHAKGLEFPFVICVAGLVRTAYAHRNALYMIISRSFIKTYFLVSNRTENQGFLQRARAGLQSIYRNGFLEVIEPTDQEKENMRSTIIKFNEQLSLYDMMIKIFDELKVEKRYRSQLHNIVQSFALTDEYSYDDILEMVSANYKILKKTK